MYNIQATILYIYGNSGEGGGRGVIRKVYRNMEREGWSERASSNAVAMKIEAETEKTTCLYFSQHIIEHHSQLVEWELGWKEPSCRACGQGSPGHGSCQCAGYERAQRC